MSNGINESVTFIELNIQKQSVLQYFCVYGERAESDSLGRFLLELSEQ